MIQLRLLALSYLFGLVRSKILRGIPRVRVGLVDQARLGDVISAHFRRTRHLIPWLCLLLGLWNG